MEEMINLKKYLKTSDTNLNKNNVIVHVRRMDLLHFFDNNIDFFEKSNTLKLLKLAFKEKNENPWKISKYSEYKNIAIHIRRPDNYDITLYKDSKTMEDRLSVPNELYIKIINQLISLWPNCKIHIYSQVTDNESEFSQYKSIDEDKIILHLNGPLDKNFIEMVYADVLVLAPSSLSYTAGLLSDNMIYYMRYASPPLSYWNIISGYSCSTKYNFLINNNAIPRMLSIRYDSIKDDINIENINDLRI
jgi:hypothetical protein